MSYTPYYSSWEDATYDGDGNVVTPSPTPGTAAAFTWWDTALGQALPQTFKGDLVAFDGTQPVRQPIGSADQVATVDPASTVGWSWKNPTGGSGGSGGGGSAAGTFSVMDFGAAGNGTTDDTAAITSAVGAAVAAPGGRVLFPPGTYATTAAIDVPENVTLEGVHSDTIPYATSPPSPCVIKPLNSHSGIAIVQLRSKTDTGRTFDHVGARIRNLTLDGTNTPAGTKGIRVAGLVREARFEYVTINLSKDTSFWFGAGTTDTAQPQSLRVIGCLAKASGNNGYTFTNVPDSTVIDCNSLGATNSGFVIQGFMNGQLTNVRAEWSGQNGLYFTSGFWSNGQGSGGCIVSSVTTDRNGFNGVLIDATGAGALQFNGMVNRRDGRNNGTGGGGYAGVAVAAGATMPVILDNLQVYPGVDDNGTGTNSPQFGLLTANATPVTLTSGYVFAATTAISVTATSLVSPAVGTATGLTTAPTRVAPSQAAPSVITASVKTANYTLALTDANTAIEMNLAGANTLTVPANASVAFPIGTTIEVCQYGAGQTTLTPAVGVTLRSSAALTTRAQYSTVSLRKRGTDEWIASGDVT